MVTRNQKPETRKSICLFCSLGCKVAFRTAGEQVVAIDYDGPLCPRGHYNFELLNHPARLTEPRIGQRKLSWSEALSFLGHKLKEFDPDSIGILLSCLSSNEDAYLAAKLAKLLGTRNIAACGDPADLDAYEGMRSEAAAASLATLEDIDKSEALLIAGDALTRSPVLSKRINKVKYGKRGNQIIVMDRKDSHTSWFATSQKEDQFSRAARGVVFFVPGSYKQGSCYAKTLAAASPNKKYIILYSYGNTLGVNIVLDRMLPSHASYAEMIKKIEGGQIKALLMLGEDVSVSHPQISRIKFVAMSNYFAPDSADDSILLLPLASHLEESASFTLADGRCEAVEPVAAKVGTKSHFEIIASLMNTQISPEEIKKEAAAVVAEGIPPKAPELKEVKFEGGPQTLNITHFGNNSLVKNFYWYRVNNKVG